jgi:hypothetical protein
MRVAELRIAFEGLRALCPMREEIDGGLRQGSHRGVSPMPGRDLVDSTITRTVSGSSILPVKRQELHVADLIPLVPFTGFAKSLWKEVNSLATVKSVGSDGSL